MFPLVLTASLGVLCALQIPSRAIRCRVFPEKRVVPFVSLVKVDALTYEALEARARSSWSVKSWWRDDSHPEGAGIRALENPEPVFEAPSFAGAELPHDIPLTLAADPLYAPSLAAEEMTFPPETEKSAPVQSTISVRAELLEMR